MLSFFPRDKNYRKCSTGYLMFALRKNRLNVNNIILLFLQAESQHLLTFQRPSWNLVCHYFIYFLLALTKSPPFLYAWFIEDFTHILFILHSSSVSNFFSCVFYIRPEAPVNYIPYSVNVYSVSAVTTEIIRSSLPLFCVPLSWIQSVAEGRCVISMSVYSSTIKEFLIRWTNPIKWSMLS